jgi:hypothetical protein
VGGVEVAADKFISYWRAASFINKARLRHKKAAAADKNMN